MTEYIEEKRLAKMAPLVLVIAVRIVPLMIATQFLLAGLALYYNGAIWGWHGLIGMSLLVPIAVIVLSPYFYSSVRPLRWWALLLGCLYLVQLVLIITGQNMGQGLLIALHVFNGVLVLKTSLVLLAKVEWSHTRF